MEHLSHFVAGWVAGMFGVIVGHPMDTIKTYQQTSNVELSMRQAIFIIIKRNGIQGMYKGILFPLLCSGCLNSMYFGAYEISMKSLQTIHGNEKIHPTNAYWMRDLFIAGCIGGFAQAFLSCPTELIKIRMQIGKGIDCNNNIICRSDSSNNSTNPLGSCKTASNIYRNYGIHGLFVGLLPTLLRDTFGGGVYILTYQYTRYYMYGKLNVNPGDIETIVAGGLAGMVSWIPVIPFDIIKSRIQADNLQNPVYKGMANCTVNLFKHSHCFGFFRGFTVITIRSVPVNIAIMWAYQFVLWFCKQLRALEI
ncbi:PREDICTED: solute carrier family 25 member 45 [Ceratosolen solmsi marchali]|uniref:Solute carrier family 25 member 45 n=1 Tax=Ceratosolen solmsi marchali TaxID=326594 RepID=A0AAJ6YEB4_9HYME|nr:PREDICTED: solute carrier family 25 member 45 [Ceratosolen solmsi marchali]